MCSPCSSTDVARLLVADLRSRAPVWTLSDAGMARLRREAPPGWEIRVIAAHTDSDGDGGAAPGEEVRRAVADAEVYFGFGISPALFRAAKGVRWIHSAAAGVGSLLFPELVASGVIVTNSAGVHAVPIAEYVTGGVLYLLRGFDLAIARQRAATWDRDAFVGTGSPVREVRDCRALIIGTGGLGSAIAERLSALGCACTGVRRRPERGTPAGFRRVVGPLDWDVLLPETDIVVLAAPATPDTAGLLSAARLGRLPPRALVVNVARGALLDEEALAEGVRQGRLRGAVLDVFRQEPLPAASPLWGLPSVLLTPHVSGVSPQGFWGREMDLFTDNWRRYVAGEPLRNVVSRTDGY